MSNELYERRMNICRELRTTEEELAAVDKLIDDWREGYLNGTDEKAVFTVYIDGEDTRFNLSETDALKCLEKIRDSYLNRMGALEQDLINTTKHN